MRQCSVTKLERRNEQTFAMLWGLLILGACAGDEHQKMLAHLEELERQNLADSVMANDSLAERLAVYFDQHGTTNERMRAHYILGRTYADLGEAPAALDEYHIAADCTDTTATDCDYRILTRVYAQTTSLFYKQLMPNEMLEELSMMEAVAMKAKDTLSWINVDAWKYVAFDLLNEHAKARNSAKSAYSKYLAYYDETTAAECLPALIDILVKEEN